MNRATIVLLLGLVLVSRAVGQPSARQTVAVFLKFDQAHSADAVSEMRQQAERLLAPLGFAPDWRLLESSDGTETFPHLAVIRFRGACRSTGAPGLAPEPWTADRVLASSLVSGGRVLPFGEVLCDEVHRFLRGELRGLQPTQREQQYGHALGSFVAHEIYHMLTNSVHHDREGAGKSCYRPAELRSKHLSFARGVGSGDGLGTAPAAQPSEITP